MKRKAPRYTEKMRDAAFRPIKILNWRVCHSQKRWGGVFVNDNFGENDARIAARNRRRTYGGVEGYETDLTQSAEPVTGYDVSFYLEDVALWERISIE